MEYITRVIAAAVFGAVAYVAVWLLLGIAFRWLGLAGAALLNVALLHIVVQHMRTWKEVL